MRVPTSHPRVQVTLDPELANAIDRASTYLDSHNGRAGLIRTLALRGAEEIAHQAESETEARARAVDELLAYDFSQLTDIVVKRESDLADKLPTPARPLNS
jgi:chemotaxis regulatin CheY-phosphate phosphatase CheZ